MYFRLPEFLEKQFSKDRYSNLDCEGRFFAMSKKSLSDRKCNDEKLSRRQSELIDTCCKLARRFNSIVDLLSVETSGRCDTALLS